MGTLGGDTLIMQASYYFMGHFSRFIPRGSRQVALQNSVKVSKNVTQADVLGKRLQFVTCSDSMGQTWHYNATDKTLRVYGLCAQVNVSQEVVFLASCKEGESGQQWSIDNETVSNLLNGKCLSSVQTGGQAIGLDAGVDVDAGLVETCGNGSSPGYRAPLQNFTFGNVGNQSFPVAFRLQTSKGTCMLPAGFDDVVFDAVAFETPQGLISLVVMNLGDTTLSFDVYDLNSHTSAKAVILPPHAIATYTWGAQETFQIFM